MSLLLLFRPSTGVAGVSLPNVFVLVPALARSVVVPLIATVAVPAVTVGVEPSANPAVTVPRNPSEVLA